MILEMQKVNRAEVDDELDLEAVKAESAALAKQPWRWKKAMLNDRRLTDAEKGRLATFCEVYLSSRHGKAFATEQQVAWRLGCDVRTWRRTLKKARELGYLQVVRERRNQVYFAEPTNTQIRATVSSSIRTRVSSFINEPEQEAPERSETRGPSPCSDSSVEESSPLESSLHSDSARGLPDADPAPPENGATVIELSSKLEEDGPVTKPSRYSALDRRKPNATIHDLDVTREERAQEVVTGPLADEIPVVQSIATAIGNVTGKSAIEGLLIWKGLSHDAKQELLSRKLSRELSLERIAEIISFSGEKCT